MPKKKPRKDKTVAGGARDADYWLQQFIKLVEIHFQDEIEERPATTDLSAFQAAAIRAVVEALSDAGLDSEAILERLGQAALELDKSPEPWSDALNERRCDLIDKEIQGTISLPERVELAKLTAALRREYDREEFVPMKGAIELHRKLMQMQKGRSK